MLSHTSNKDSLLSTTYGTRYFASPVPEFKIPEEKMPARAAYRMIHDELALDANPALNLASFVTTWMEPEARKLMDDTLDKNFVDQDEYPQTKKIHDRVISMLAALFNAPADCKSVGTATIGSSEAIMLALLAHKWTWKKKRKAKGLPFDRPNVVFGADVHTCWEKFALYFDVEMRVVPMEPDCFILRADKARTMVDENTIAVGAVLGTTFTGQIDEIEAISDMLDGVEREHGWDIPIHVDGASGGFIAPFVYPERKWDFRLKRVRSINVSNHKFGLVYPGMGSVIFKDRTDLPEELVYHINYLGGDMPNYSLNFSRPSGMILLQYYNFLRLGMSGYREIMGNIMNNAAELEKLLLKTGRFELLNESCYLPVVVIRLKDESAFSVFDISEKLKARSWVVPAYSLPANAQEIAVLRMVVRENFSLDMARMLAADMEEILAELDASENKVAKPVGGKSRHRVC